MMKPKTIANYTFCMLIIITCIGTSAHITFAQDDPANGGTIRGTITDLTPAQNPLAGVEVKIVDVNNKEITVKTDANGEYKRSGLPAGRYLISTYKRGYNTRLGRPVTVANGGDHLVRLKMTKKDDIEKQWSEGLIQLVAESIGTRYTLEAPIVEALHQSILEALNSVLEQLNRDVTAFAKTEGDGSVGLLEGLFSHPDCKAAFAKYLTETQLQDYMDFIKMLRQRDQQAFARYITAWLDQELSLTADQRKAIEQSILDTRGHASFPIALTTLEFDSLDILNLIHDELKIPVDATLRETQSKIWKQLIKSQARTKELIAAKLTAHSELLGPLDENASRRLTVAIKGVVQQHFDAREKEAERMFRKVEAVLMRGVEAGEIKPEHVAEILNDMREELGNEEGVIQSQLSRLLPHADTIKHPLYQQAIKDVLSAAAFMQYKNIQAEREAFRQQASRDLVVTGIGTQMIFDDTQRKQLETIAAKLNTDVVLDICHQLLQQVDIEKLSPRQQEFITFMQVNFELEFGEQMRKNEEIQRRLEVTDE